jgi:glycerol kinase
MSLPNRSPARGYVAALDQGTTSTRCVLLDREGRTVATDARPLPVSYPRPGWVEQDARLILEHARAVIAGALAEASLAPGRLAALGITNQRETTVVWDRRTAPVCDRLRAQGVEERVRAVTGLPLDPYFSATKIAWLLENTPGLRARAERGELSAGTIDAWLLWNLSGGPDGGVWATDVTNASRTLLLDLRRLDWDPAMCALFGVPAALLPAVRPSAGPEPFGTARLEGGDVPVTAILGDQQAALVGHGALGRGDIKNTYGTGSFLLLNTGPGEPPRSGHGLLSTVAYQFAPMPPVYALEGSVFTTGAAIQWLRDGLGIIASADETEPLARSVPDTGGVVFVPAFAGLGAPYWDADARGALFGLTRGTTRAHIVRAALEAIAHQTREVVDAMQADVEGIAIKGVRVDGGAAANDFLCQFQADLLQRPLLRPRDRERTALGAAYAAGWAAGFWELGEGGQPAGGDSETFLPALPGAGADAAHARWKEAVARTMHWERTEP